MEKGQEKNFKVFQTLRFIAFLMIFIHHTGKYNSIRYYNSAWAVSFFIMLSGWLNGYKYFNKYTKIKFKDILDLVRKRLKTIYPLHLVTLVLSIPLSGIFFYKSFKDIIKWGIMLFSNISLTQGYINNQLFYFAFNGVSWFLCLTVYTIIMTIPLLYILNKIKNSKYGTLKLILLMFICIFAMFLYNIYIYVGNYSKEFWLYIFPIARLPEFVVGLILGGILSNIIKSKILKNILQVISIAFIVVCIFINEKYNTYALFWSTAWIIPNMFLLYAFSNEETIISKILGNKVFVFLGNISMEMFLCHYILIRYVNYVVAGKEIHRYLIFVYLFITTIIVSYIINKFFSFRKVSKKIK